MDNIPTRNTAIKNSDWEVASFLINNDLNINLFAGYLKKLLFK